jgi:hypothetical protein
MLACLALISVISFAGCGAYKLTSLWRDRDVTIDGLSTEWQGTTTYIEDASVAVGLMNDSEYLYISLSTSLRSVVAEILAQGFTVWLDGEGGKRESFGVRCPIGTPQEIKDPSQFKEIAQDREKLNNLIIEKLESSAEQLEIIGPNQSDVTRLFASEVPGLEIGLGHQGGRFVYELKVPLRSSEEHPYSIGLDRSHCVGVGFETPEIDREKMAGAMPRGGAPGGGMPGGGAPPGGAMPGGGMGERGMPGGARGSGGGPGNMPERLELWTKVELASADHQARAKTGD